ncbi:uncharacterized protein JCM10292_000303 [Rhodotorula paludigena]|uniref:uncharacterized protein n=1 Tax=Rhodotorula paludigena TaxID=86838 RepID=UPI00316F7974
MSSEPIPVVDNTPPVPPAPAASLSDIKHDVEKLAPGSLVGYSGEENGENGRRPVHLARKLNARQITFIGFSGGIGTGLFIGAGAAYAKSGPAGLFLAYSVVGSILWCVMQSISELGTLIPTAGSFPHWATRFIDPSVGFSLALSYGYCYTIAIASEVSAAAVIVSYWTDLTPAVVISVGLALIIAINLLPVRFYGEAEVATAIVKILCFLGLVVVSLVITLGGAPNGDRIGFRYWNDPGPWVDYNGITGATGHFCGFLAAFVNASFSFIGVETVVVAAAEAENPHRSIPKAARRVTARIGFFCTLGSILIGMTVDPRNPDLTSGSGNANSSPWVLAIKAARIPVLDSIVNACILISAWSAGNSYCWVGSRMITAMVHDKQLPSLFGITNKHGTPYYAVLLSFAFGPLAYLSLGSGGASQAFAWLQNLSTIAGLIAWGTLCAAYLRFHRGCKVQGVDRSSFPWKSPLQPFTAWYGFIGSVIVTFVSGFSVFLKGNWDAQDFIAAYIGIPIFIVPILLWKLFKRTRFVRAREMDLFSGRLDPASLPIPPVPTTAWGKFIDWLF